MSNRVTRTIQACPSCHPNVDGLDIPRYGSLLNAPPHSGGSTVYSCAVERSNACTACPALTMRATPLHLPHGAAL